MGYDNLSNILNKLSAIIAHLLQGMKKDTLLRVPKKTILNS